MITDGEKWHYLDAESLSRLLHGITSEYNDHNYMNCLHSEQKTNLNHMRLCQRIMTVVTIMPEACKKILKITQNHKSVETPFVILADNESLL